MKNWQISGLISIIETVKTEKNIIFSKNIRRQSHSIKKQAKLIYSFIQQSHSTAQSAALVLNLGKAPVSELQTFTNSSVALENTPFHSSFHKKSSWESSQFMLSFQYFHSLRFAYFAL